MFTRALRFVESLPPVLLFLLLLVVTVLVGIADYLTGTDATFSAIYLFPICAAAWYLGRRSAYIFSVLSSISWVGGDILAGAYYSTIWIPIWNLASRFAIFI